MGDNIIGYKMHLITTETGVLRDLLFTPGSVRDTVFLKMLSKEDEHLSKRELIADRGYIVLAIRVTVRAFPIVIRAFPIVIKAFPIVIRVAPIHTPRIQSN